MSSRLAPASRPRVCSHFEDSEHIRSSLKVMKAKPSNAVHALMLFYLEPTDKSEKECADSIKKPSDKLVKLGLA